MLGRFAFKLVNGLYWLFLGTWIGAIVMLALAAGITFSVMGDAAAGEYAFLPDFTEEQGRRTAGAIVRNVIQGVGFIEATCAMMVVIMTALQCTLFADRLWPRAARRMGLPGGWLNWARIALVLLPIAILGVQANRIGPALDEQRAIMYSETAPPEDVAKARLKFDDLHQRSVRLTSASLSLLVAAMIVSAFLLHTDRNEVAMLEDALARYNPKHGQESDEE